MYICITYVCMPVIVCMYVCMYLLTYTSILTLSVFMDMFHPKNVRTRPDMALTFGE